MNVYVCLENPDSWQGDKKDNLGEKVQPQGPVQHRNVGSRENKFEARKEIANLMHDKSKQRDHKNLRSLMKKPDPCGEGVTVQLGASGSLPSMISRLIRYQQTLGATIDTIVFVGHGNDNSMSTGSGHFAFSTEHAEKVVSYKKREISMSNVDKWRPTFQALVNQVAPADDGNGFINIFLLGCNTGSGGLLAKVAETLYGVFDEPVCVYGFDAESCWDDTKHVLQNIEKITKDCEPHKQATGKYTVSDVNLKFAAYQG